VCELSKSNIHSNKKSIVLNGWISLIASLIFLGLVKSFSI
jgi:hypothetical protein